jgi:hypothetical protein
MDSYVLSQTRMMQLPYNPIFNATSCACQTDPSQQVRSLPCGTGSSLLNRETSHPAAAAFTAAAPANGGFEGITLDVCCLCQGSQHVGCHRPWLWLHVIESITKLGAATAEQFTSKRCEQWLESW